MITNNKIYTLLATLAGLLLTTLPFSFTSMTSGPTNVKELKRELKQAAHNEETKMAKSIVVSKEGIKFKGASIPVISQEVKVLTVRLTVYWARGSGTDSDSRKMRSSTGYTLKEGESIAVDPRIIPYNREVIIPNVGLVKAVDTGTAVKNKVASGGKLPVIDVFFVNKRDALDFADSHPKIVKVAVLN
jgi:3D (Asp-Asp-Asp) domain-containing protein